MSTAPPRSAGLYIDGVFESLKNPATKTDRWTGELIGTVEHGTRADATRAVDAAQKALELPLTPAQRHRIFVKVRKSLEKSAEDFARLITAEVGKPIQAARVEVSRALDTLRFCAEETGRLVGEMVPLDAVPSGDGTLAFTVFEPRGIVAAITPFNFPLNLLLHKVGPALGAGNSVVLKPSERTPLIAFETVRLFHEAGLPPGWLNLVTGEPSEIVSEWQLDPRVVTVTFTGSSKVGWELKRQAPEKHHILELGSNTALVVTASADVDRAAAAAVSAAFGNSGQACVSLQRVYVESSAASKFESAVSREMEGMRAGNPYLEDTVVGPLVGDSEVQRLSNWLEEAVDAGAQVLTRFASAENLLGPTILKSAGEDTRIIREEAFGPVFTINTVPDLATAISLVNKSDFGLNVGLFTGSISDAMRFAREAQAGSVLVNMPPSHRSDTMPYSAIKGSGNGREGVKYAMRELSHEKLIVFHP